MTAPALRVLVAEDEPHLGVLVEQFLRGRGLELVLGCDGGEAAARLAAERYDVALLDVQMPVADGLVVLDGARALADPPEVIVVTGNAAGHAAVEALRRGAYAHVAKPYRMAEVELVVRRAGEKRALRAEVAALRAELQALRGGPAPSDAGGRSGGPPGADAGGSGGASHAVQPGPPTG